MVKIRETNFTEAPVNDWHRRALSSDYPCLDLDCVLVEYDKSKPCALIEYKHENAKPVEELFRTPNYCALCNLGNAAGLPVFEVRWRHDFKRWLVTPLNHIGYLFIAQTIECNEIGYKRFLQDLRELPTGYKKSLDYPSD